MADAEGLDAVTMRRLARALGVEAMSLYNHVDGKDGILDGLVELVYSQIGFPAAGDDWEASLRQFARRAHDVLLRHAWACGLILAPSPHGIGARMRYIEALLGFLRAAGFSPELGYHAYHAIDSHILGFTMWQLGHAVDPAGMKKAEGVLAAHDFPNLRAHAEQHRSGAGEGEVEFEFGLDLLIEGFKRRLGGASL
jgi:AcrR family transcriptional regulator